MAADDPGNVFGLGQGGPGAGERKAADQDVAVDGVDVGARRVGQVDQPLTVGRGVGGSIFANVAGDLLGVGIARAGAGGRYPPHVSGAGAVRDEVNPAPVGRILRRVVGTRTGREVALGTPVRRDREQVEPTPMIGREGERPAVGRPRVDVILRGGRDTLRLAAFGGKLPDRPSSEGQRLAVSGNGVIDVDPGRRASRDWRGRAARNGHGAELAAAVDDQAGSVGGPFRRRVAVRRVEDNLR